MVFFSLIIEGGRAVLAVRIIASVSAPTHSSRFVCEGATAAAWLASTGPTSFRSVSESQGPNLSAPSGTDRLPPNLQPHGASARWSGARKGRIYVHVCVRKALDTYPAREGRIIDTALHCATYTYSPSMQT